ncbi:hypothetical protein [Alicyclobacillus shizuokensis]|uniref:hypothetical protein n=1 Tax=Alicyclobacillus shizuokensis TaxID=392014 RepID=UPI00082AB8A5|nr:hypothetical protein [Alicyclobacillus shizuokensis]
MKKVVGYGLAFILGLVMSGSTALAATKTANDTYPTVVKLPPKNVKFNKPPYIIPWGPDHNSKGVINTFYYRSYYEVMGNPTSAMIKAAQTGFTYARTHDKSLTVGKDTINFHWVGVGDWDGYLWDGDGWCTFYVKIDDNDWGHLTHMFKTYKKKQIIAAWDKICKDVYNHSVAIKNGLEGVGVEFDYNGILHSNPTPYLNPNTTSEGNQYHKFAKNSWRMNLNVVNYIGSRDSKQSEVAPPVIVGDIRSHN